MDMQSCYSEWKSFPQANTLASQISKHILFLISDRKKYTARKANYCNYCGI